MSKSHVLRLLFIVQVFLAVTVPTSKCATIKGCACEVKARTNAGWVCGKQQTYDNHTFASFLNVPYSRQPVGSLRFQELQPAEPWDGYYDATKVGPICPQYDLLYGSLMTNKNSSEACIHANIFVPMHALPTSKNKRKSNRKTTGLPIFVFIHGGGFSVGSGDPDVNGPEYLVTEDMIVVTFNYRLHVLGYMQLSPVLPGNNGLRDIITLLKWVQVNAKYIGGNPNDVTIAGQSAGAASAHLLTLSKAADGLFNRAILMSGAGIRSFYTATPKFENITTQLLQNYLDIKSTEPEEILQQLVALPLETLLNATYKIQAIYGFIYFAPVVEFIHENFTTVIDEDPEVLLRNGQGKDIPLIIGVTYLEGDAFIPYYTENNALAAIASDRQNILPPDLHYKLPETELDFIANETYDRCFNGDPTVKKFVKCFADFTIVYPAIKLAQIRASTENSAPVFFYQFSYNSSCSPIKETKNITYDGAAHIDDLSFYMRMNSMKKITCFKNPSANDIEIRKQIIRFVKNFSTCNNPVCDTSDSSPWPAETQASVQYENIVSPSNIYYTQITEDQADVVNYLDKFYDQLYDICTS